MPLEKYSKYLFFPNIYYVVDVHDNHRNDDTCGIDDNDADVNNVHTHGDYDIDANGDDCDDPMMVNLLMIVMMTTMMTMMMIMMRASMGIKMMVRTRSKIIKIII